MIKASDATPTSARMEGGFRNTSKEKHPLLSVVAVVFRDKDEVAGIIDNVTPFRGDDLELIFVDGASDDGTVEFLQANQDVVDYWLSESDRGVYDAMNKGIDAARGEYVLHLNAGDRLLYAPLEELRACLRDKIDVACFRVALDGGGIHVPANGFGLRLDNTWHHQGTFYRREAHLRYDPEFKVFGDFDLNQRMAKAGSTVRLLNRIVAHHGTPGLSAGKKNFGEVYSSIRKNSGWAYLPLAFIRFKVKGVKRRLTRLLHPAGA